MTSNTNETSRALNEYYQSRSGVGRHIEIKDLKPLQGGIDHIMYSFDLVDVEGKTSFIQPSVLRLYKNIESAEFEYKVMEKLRHTDVPVPKVFILERDAKYLGSPFITMEKVKGDSLGNLIVPKLANGYSWFNSQEFAGLWSQYAGLLASIHGLDWQGLGLGFLKPSEWSIETVAASFSTPAVLGLTARSEEFKKLIEWCLARVPKSANPESVILHADYHFNNVMVYGDKVLAVIDWTDICLGDAVIDVSWANFILYMAGAEELINPFIIEYKRLSGRELAALALYEVIAGFRGFQTLNNLFSTMSAGGLNSNFRSDAAAILDINKTLNKVFGFIYQKTGIDISNIVKLTTRSS